MVNAIQACAKGRRTLHTSLTGHEVFSLVFAVVETAGQNHIIVVSLRKKIRNLTRVRLHDIDILPSIGVLTCCPEVSSLRKAMDSSWFPLLVRARRHGSLASNPFSRKLTARRAFACTARK